MFPLIQLFSQLKKTQVLDCIELLTNCKNGEILTEVAANLDQIVLSCCGGRLGFVETPGMYSGDLATCLRYTPAANNKGGLSFQLR